MQSASIELTTRFLPRCRLEMTMGKFNCMPQINHNNGVIARLLRSGYAIYLQ
jgi:hypothetical protein